MTRKLFITVLLTLLLVSVVAAQSSSGQLCIRAFEDRNGNGEQDANEPPIIRGVAATLANATGVIIDTALMETSSSASSGTLCFQRLEAGQYTIRVSSADYVATTVSDFTAAVSDSGIPQVLSYGGQFIPVEMPVEESGISEEERLQITLVKAVIAGIGALVVMGAMVVIGAIIYFAVIRNRRPARTGVYQPVPGTGQYPRVGTGQYQAVPGTGQYQAVPGTGQYPATNTPPRGTPAVADDTDMPNVVTQEDAYNMYSDDEDDTNKPAQRINPDPYGDVPDDNFQFDDEDSPYRPPHE